MDGGQGRLNASLQRKLSVVLSLTIALVALVAGALSFMAAYDEAQELQDDVLRQVAQLLVGQRLAPEPGMALPHFKDHDDNVRLFVHPMGQPNPSGLHVDEGGPLPVPATLRDGLHTLTLNGESFRVLIGSQASGARFVVAQETDLRDAMAQDSALRTVLPFLVLVPVLLLIVITLLRQMFRSVTLLAQEVDARGEHDLHSIPDAPVPAEVRPFVRAINRLLARVAQAMDVQRRFVADAAHELRSPLTAMSLQAERLAEADMPAEARERLATLRQGIERGRGLLEQLLSLARAQSPSDPPARPISVQAIYRRVLEDLMPLAEARHIDIGVMGQQDARVGVSELDLFTLVRNLVDNAIRYTPEGGRVDLALDLVGPHAVLRIQDTGPGIAPAERERVFDPFHRLLGSGQPGSGLGLAIVRSIVQRIGAELRLGYTDEARQQGLSVAVRLPVAG